MDKDTEYISLKPVKLLRKDGKIVTAEFYNNHGCNNIEILDIKKLKFEGMPYFNYFYP